MGSLSVKTGGAWKTVNTVKAKVNGAWTQVKQVYAKINGVWKPVWVYATSATVALPNVASTIDYNTGDATGQTLSQVYSSVSGTTATVNYSSLQLGGTVGVSLWYSGYAVIRFTGATITSYSHTFDTGSMTVSKSSNTLTFKTTKTYAVLKGSFTATLNITADSLTVATAVSGICEGSGTMTYMKPGS